MTALGYSDTFGALKFLSTPSVWRVTVEEVPELGLLAISIHTLRVEGDSTSYSVLMHFAWAISIHTLRVEGDGIHPSQIQQGTISIHTLRVEGDFG